jgi:ComF family protein
VQKGVRTALSILGREALQIVLPSWCAVCDRELPWRDRVASCCTPCWTALPRIHVERCRSCALPAPVPVGAPYVCIDCTADPLPVDWCEAWGEYRGGLEKLLHAFKFERQDFLDEALASLLEERLRDSGDVRFDVVAPVPMSAKRERRRGYNQAELLSRALARRIGVACDASLLAAREGRATQSTLSRKERAANVRGAFTVKPGAAAGQSILLVDDICTTGETLRACALALLGEGASRVCAITVAKAT